VRIFWHNGALQLLPESEREIKLLAELSENIKFEKPPEMLNCIPGGSTESGSDGLFELLVANHEGSPSRFTRETHHKQSVISINKLP
jgi:hypothetical protein